jgi:hypothetical protein
MAPAQPTHKDLTDVEKGTLIEEIRTHVAIWDPTHENHSKRAVINTLFDEIGTFMSTNERTITGNIATFQHWYFDIFRQSSQNVVGQS